MLVPKYGESFLRFTRSGARNSKIACGVAEFGDGLKSYLNCIPSWAALTVCVPLPEKLPDTLAVKQSA